jgi:TIR domain
VTTLYALGRALAAERILSLEGVYAAIEQQFPEQAESLRQSGVDRALQVSLLRFFRYHRLALAESLLAREPDGYRLMMYTEWRQRYEDPSSGLDRLLEPATESLQLLSPKRDLEQLIESLADIASLVGEMTGMPAKAYVPVQGPKAYVPVQGRRPNGIFICYRRGMAAGHAARLKDRLTQRFPPPYQVFMDVDAIPAAARWGQEIEDAIRSSGVVLVLIAKDWMQPQQAERQPDNLRGGNGPEPAWSRLDDPEDYVRREIETALRYSIPLIPVLIDRVNPPPLEKLPESVRVLFSIEAIDLEVKRWDDDVSNVMEAVERFVKPRPPSRPRQTFGKTKRARDRG